MMMKVRRSLLLHCTTQSFLMMKKNMKRVSNLYMYPFTVIFNVNTINPAHNFPLLPPFVFYDLQSQLVSVESTKTTVMMMMTTTETMMMNMMKRMMMMNEL